MSHIDKEITVSHEIQELKKDIIAAAENGHVEYVNINLARLEGLWPTNQYKFFMEFSAEMEDVALTNSKH